MNLGALGNELTSFFKVFTKQSNVLLYVGSPIILDLTCHRKQIESFSRLHPRCIKALLFPGRAFLKLIKRLTNTEKRKWIEEVSSDKLPHRLESQCILQRNQLLNQQKDGWQHCPWNQGFSELSVKTEK